MLTRSVEWFFLLREIAVNSVEMGAISLGACRSKLQEMNLYKAHELDNFFMVLENRGIKDMKELAIASDRVLGGIIADLICVFDDLEMKNRG
jgi:hypothetical protein